MFEWDEAKRLRNIEKHGLDFQDAADVFDGRDELTATSGHRGEERYVSVAQRDDGKFYTVVWTKRGLAQRIISFRRARDGEERAYRQIFG